MHLRTQRVSGGSNPSWEDREYPIELAYRGFVNTLIRIIIKTPFATFRLGVSVGLLIYALVCSLNAKSEAFSLMLWNK